MREPDMLYLQLCVYSYSLGLEKSVFVNHLTHTSYTMLQTQPSRKRHSIPLSGFVPGQMMVPLDPVSIGMFVSIRGPWWACVWTGQQKSARLYYGQLRSYDTTDGGFIENSQYFTQRSLINFCWTLHILQLTIVGVVILHLLIIPVYHS